MRKGESLHFNPKMDRYTRGAKRKDKPENQSYPQFSKGNWEYSILAQCIYRDYTQSYLVASYSKIVKDWSTGGVQVCKVNHTVVVRSYHGATFGQGITALVYVGPQSTHLLHEIQYLEAAMFYWTSFYTSVSQPTNIMNNPTNLNSLLTTLYRDQSVPLLSSVLLPAETLHHTIQVKISLIQD